MVPSESKFSSYGDLLICSKYLNQIFIIDTKNRTIGMRWGANELDGPHHPTITKDDTILLFDNGLSRGFSRVLEIDPIENRILWKYSGDEQDLPYSATRGSALRLPNGNTLIGAARAATILEVNKQKEIVWRLDLYRSRVLRELGIEDPRFYRALYSPNKI